MEKIRIYQFPVSLFLTFVFSFYAVGCNRYIWRVSQKDKIVNLTDKPIRIFLVDSYQPAVRAWAVNATSMNKQSVIGKIRPLSPGEIRGMRLATGNKSERLSEHRVILSLNKEYAAQLHRAPTDSIALDQVVKMEVYQYDQAASAVATVFTVIGVTALVAVVIVILAFALKSGSCPFVYADNPEGRVFEGELYSGATFPQLERHDWLPMPHLKPTGDTYRVAVANKVKEIQHTNLLELVAVDHPNQTSVLFDKYGKLHTLATPQAPISATALDGQDVRSQIIREDSLRFFGTPDNKTQEASESLILQFQRPPGAKQAKLVINAKNSMWLDHAHGLMLDEFGAHAAKIRETNLGKSAGELQDWMLQQNIPLSVWIETAPGHWERGDYFNLAGPMALKRDVLSLDVSKVQGEQIKVKLEFGFLFWEIDYVGMDFTADQQTTIHALTPVSAIGQDGADLTSALRADDAAYYDQPNIGDEAAITFPALPLQPGLQRSLILHAKGHYQILREPSPDRPKLRHLKEFTKPNAFPVYAREQWFNLVGGSHTGVTSKL